MSENNTSSLDPVLLRESVISMVVESWRVSRVFERILNKLDAGEKTRYVSQFRWFMKKVDEALLQANMKVVNVEGQVFDPGMAATAINIDEFDSEDTLIVDKMLEPIIMDNDGIVRSGTVILKKVEK